MTQQADRKVEVLVVGAGPVGLTAALCAARRGLTAEVIDQSYRGWGRGHATLLHPSSVRILSELGIAPKLEGAGRRIGGIVLHADQTPPHRIELSAPVLAVSQAAIEGALLAALRAADVEIRAPFQAATIQQDESRVSVRVVRRELVEYGSPANFSDWQPLESSIVEAEFVIGADGYDSQVRSALGIDSTTVEKTEAFAMFEVPLQRDLGSDLHLSFATGLASVVVPLADSRVRLGFQLDTELDAEPGLERLKSLVAERLPWFEYDLERIDWGSVIHFERRLARSFGAGRVWLAGDAAHVTSPFGAQSMNAGITEAHELVHAIASARASRNGYAQLEQYGQRREREWQKLLGYNVKFELLPHAPLWLVAHARRVAPALPLSGADMQATLRTLGLEIA